MVGGITNNPNQNINALQGHGTENAQAPDQNNGIVARGVGMFQKAWLQLTRQAGAKHTQQLTNLKAQVSREFGEGGLKVLNDKLSAKKWDSPNSTKLFSKSELNNLRKQVKDGASMAAFKMDFYKKMDADRAAPALDKSNAADVAQQYRNEQIEAKTRDLHENQSHKLLDALGDGSHVSRFEAIQGAPTVSNKANEIIGNSSIADMLNDSLHFLKLDPVKDITPGMINDVIRIAESYCIPDALREVVLPDQELNGLMKEAMAESLAKLDNVMINGSHEEQVIAVRDFVTGNLQDFFAHASDMYFDRLDNASIQQGREFIQTANLALPELARAEATKIVDAEKATLIAAERAPIEQNLRFNLAHRETYPELSATITNLELGTAKSALEQGIVHPRGEHLDLIDRIAHFSEDTDSPSPHMLDELGTLANSILDDDAPWADMIPTNERALIQTRTTEMEVAANGDDYDKRVAASNFLNTLESVNQVISYSYYENYLANEPTFSKALNEQATNVVNKQIRDERNAEN